MDFKILGFCDLRFFIVPVYYSIGNFIKIGLYLLKYGDLTIFKIAIVLHHEF